MGSENDPDDEGEVCGICRVPYEGRCPTCKMPSDDFPLTACASPSVCLYVV
ncbi:hypothetical protein ID866_11606 [Astraeus odoratus]|nr:hypothetical protein ID866_11606 [Astraeus odoratus]